MAKKRRNKKRKGPKKEPLSFFLVNTVYRWFLNLCAITCLAMAGYFFYGWIFVQAGVPERAELTSYSGLLEDKEIVITKHSRGGSSYTLVLQVNSVPKLAKLPLDSDQVPVFDDLLTGDRVDVLLQPTCVDGSGDEPCRIWGLEFNESTFKTYQALRDAKIENNKQGVWGGLFMLASFFFVLHLRKTAWLDVRGSEARPRKSV